MLTIAMIIGHVIYVYIYPNYSDDNWICHLGHPWASTRMEVLRNMIESNLHHNASSFSAVIDHLSTHTVHVEGALLSDTIFHKDLVRIQLFAKHMMLKIVN